MSTLLLQVINVCLYVIAAYQICKLRARRTYCLYDNEKKYQFYIGSSLVQEGGYHNIYIRLQKQTSSDERVFVQLVLKGYGIEPVQLSSECGSELYIMSYTSDQTIGYL